MKRFLLITVALAGLGSSAPALSGKTIAQKCELGWLKLYMLEQKLTAKVYKHSCLNGELNEEYLAKQNAKLDKAALKFVAFIEKKNNAGEFCDTDRGNYLDFDDGYWHIPSDRTGSIDPESFQTLFYCNKSFNVPS